MLKPFYKFFHKYASEWTPSFYYAVCDNKFFIKYIISGLTATITDLSLLYIFAEYIFSEKYYLESAVLAFFIAFLVSFSMQKFWTFGDASMSGVRGQITTYFFIGVMNLLLNSVLVYTFVEYFGIWYLFAQIISGAIISGWSLILYIRFVFGRSCAAGDKSVLIASGIFPPDSGGPSIHSFNFLKGFSANGIKTAVVTYSDADKYPPTDEKNSVIRISRKIPFGLRHFLYFIKLFSASVGFGAIYAQDATAAGFPAMIVSKLLKRRFYLRIGGDILWEKIAEKGETPLSVLDFYKKGSHKKKLFFYLSGITLRSAEKLIVPSRLLSEIYEKYYGVERSKIVIIKNPVPKLSEDLKNSSERGADIIFAGRFVKYKNLDKLIDGFSKVADKIKNSRLILAGDGPELNILKARAHNLKLEDRVIFRNKMPHGELMKELSSASLCVAPALSEFNPNFILECLALNKPALLSKENGLSIALPDDFILQKGDANEIALKIEEILNKKEFYKNKIAEIMKKTSKIDMDDIINRHIKLFF